MNRFPRKIILASASPRRRDLLERFFKLRVIPSDIPEFPKPGERPTAYVKRLAREKWRFVAVKHPQQIVVAADTIVVWKDRILEKPLSRRAAGQMLKALSGKNHRVVSAVCVGRWSNSKDTQPKYCLQSVSTKIWFRVLQPREIALYLKAEEWRGKAGAYAIQGRASAFVEKIQGSLTNVIGLPLRETLDLIRFANTR